MGPSSEARPVPSASTKIATVISFWAGTVGYVLAILNMLVLSMIGPPKYFVFAELATLPTGVVWFLAGVSGVPGPGSQPGRTDAILMFASFGVSAFLNALLLRKVARTLARRMRKGKGSPRWTGRLPG